VRLRHLGGHAGQGGRAREVLELGHSHPVSQTGIQGEGVALLAHELREQLLICFNEDPAPASRQLEEQAVRKKLAVEAARLLINIKRSTSFAVRKGKLTELYVRLGIKM